MSQDFTDSNKRTEDFFAKNQHLFAPMSKCQSPSCTCGETIRKLTDGVDRLQRQLNEAKAKLMIAKPALEFYSKSWSWSQPYDGYQGEGCSWQWAGGCEGGTQANNALKQINPAFEHVLKLAAGVYVQHINNLKEGTTSWLKENITSDEHDFLMSVFEKGL